MKLTIAILIYATCLFNIIQSQCPNQISYMASFSASSFAGSWFVYQRSYTTDNRDLNRNALCDHIDIYTDSASYINYTSFSLPDQAFKSEVAAYFYDETNYPGLFIQALNPANTTDDAQNFGNPVFNVVSTDYTSYALVWYCQTLYFNTASKQYLMLLLRSLNNVETTVLPLLSNIFTTINGLTDYDGDSFELVYHDNGICKGL